MSNRNALGSTEDGDGALTPPPAPPPRPTRGNAKGDFGFVNHCIIFRIAARGVCASNSMSVARALHASPFGIVGGSMIASRFGSHRSTAFWNDGIVSAT